MSTPGGSSFEPNAVSDARRDPPVGSPSSDATAQGVDEAITLGDNFINNWSKPKQPGLNKRSQVHHPWRLGRSEAVCDATPVQLNPNRTELRSQAPIGIGTPVNGVLAPKVISTDASISRPHPCPKLVGLAPTVKEKVIRRPHPCP